MLGLIWVQTVWKSYQQTTLVGKELMVNVTKIAGCEFPILAFMIKLSYIGTMHLTK